MSKVDTAEIREGITAAIAAGISKVEIDPKHMLDFCDALDALRGCATADRWERAYLASLTGQRASTHVDGEGNGVAMEPHHVRYVAVEDADAFVAACAEKFG